MRTKYSDVALDTEFSVSIHTQGYAKATDERIQDVAASRFSENINRVSILA